MIFFLHLGAYQFFVYKKVVLTNIPLNTTWDQENLVMTILLEAYRGHEEFLLTFRKHAVFR